ncbi:MAG: cation:proton antiporter [Patescibacteria group bacterium]|jgi:Kef-type K+ transport system membrane component KefB
MEHIFLELAVVLALATGLGALARALKQPTLLGYIATGLIVGPLGLLQLNHGEVLDTLAQFGIAFLLFLAGMEMNFSELRHVGRSAVLIGASQIAFTGGIGYVIATLLGFAPLSALYVAITLSFSSTIIVIKLLSEKKALDSLYGKIVVGVLLVQDFIALGTLILLSGLSGPHVEPSQLPLTLGLTFAKGAALLVTSLLIGKYVMPKLLHRLAGSQEVLFLASLTWGLGLAALADLPSIGLTIEIGSFMAGVALSESVEHFQIMSRVRPLRDVFAVTFFITLGSKLVLTGTSAHLLPIIVLSLFVLIMKPLLVMVTMGLLGYRARTSFMTGIAIAQVSEFSLIVMALALRIGHTNQELVSIITAVALITILVSSYLILHAENLYAWLAPFLKKTIEYNAKHEKHIRDTSLKNHVVLVGAHRVGHNILRALEDLHKTFMVVDFNPDVVLHLERRGIHALYGDIADPDIQDAAGFDTARAVISTVPAFNESVHLLSRLKKSNPRAKVILTASTEFDAVALYERGADYVILPHFAGGLQLGRLLEEDKTLRTLAKLREQDLAIIIERP